MIKAKALTFITAIAITDAFILNPSTQPIAKSLIRSPSSSPAHKRSLQKLKAKKKAKNVEKKSSGVDYGFVAQQLFNPTNPYSWFVYFFIGIYALDAIKQ